MRLPGLILTPLLFLSHLGAAQFWPRPSADQQFVKLHEGVRASLVYITVTAETIEGDPRKASATGAVMTPEGHVVTVYHLLTSLRKGVQLKEDSIKFYGSLTRKHGNQEPLTIVAGDPQRDLLLLRFESRLEGFTYLCIDPSPLRNSQKIFTSGFPKEMPYRVGSGEVLSLDGENDTIVIDIPIDEGQSGSPIYLENGRLVGVALGKIKSSEQAYSIVGIEYVKRLKPSLPTNCGKATLRHVVPASPGQEKCAGKACPKDMVVVSVAAPGGGTRCWCIDRFENSAGGDGASASVAGAFPMVVERADEAVRVCKNVGKELCPADVWVTACQGDGGFAYPYGSTYQAGRCSDASLHLGGPMLTGERRECEGGYPGLFDMSGNRPEWTATGYRLFGGSHGSAPEELECGSFTVHCPVCSIGNAGFRCCLDIGVPPAAPRGDSSEFVFWTRAKTGTDGRLTRHVFSTMEKCLEAEKAFPVKRFLLDDSGCNDRQPTKDELINQYLLGDDQAGEMARVLGYNVPERGMGELRISSSTKGDWRFWFISNGKLLDEMFGSLEECLEEQRGWGRRSGPIVFTCAEVTKELLGRAKEECANAKEFACEWHQMIESSIRIRLESNRQEKAVVPLTSGLPQKEYRGQLDLTSYCRSQFDDSFRGLPGEIPKCVNGTLRHDISFGAACLWQFGSESYRVGLEIPLVLCDTSKRTDPPCKEGERFCGRDTKYCCPISVQQGD